MQKNNPSTKKTKVTIKPFYYILFEIYYRYNNPSTIYIVILGLQ